ncbi:hypothetical protein G6F70_001647 [Rhizopus microsporus]|nr:hypothetical protein G6F71_000455 [Rhizopus microsporus]KAG1203159.1 hypothetical protein G6F70_001647 [Rhizopus microsporus]KAG1215612.1 hypothetical protein G6F69_000876 [Rhizopus microsporus]KAG1238134.1 hypothetical protein G6F67_000690 [Rhizopus microsporus]KAG1268786.1 hypothetical protein G6F68_000842 [Rhizopus microsporus]
MIAAEDINELLLEDTVQKVHIDEEVCYIVKYFTMEVTYSVPVNICIWFIASTKAVWFKAKVDCHDRIDSSLRVHTMDETALIQNTIENDHSEAATDSSDVLQSEVPSEAGDRTDEVLIGLTNVCRQALESRIQ